MNSNTTDTPATNVLPFVVRPRKASPTPAADTTPAGGWEIVRDDGTEHGTVLAWAHEERYAREITAALDRRDDIIRTLLDHVFPYIKMDRAGRVARLNIQTVVRRLKGEF